MINADFQCVFACAGEELGELHSFEGDEEGNQGARTLLASF
jgi:hypothetical protein